MLTKTLKKKKTLLKKKKKILTKIEKKQVKYDTVSFQQIFDFYIVSYLYSKRSTCPEIQRQKSRADPQLSGVLSHGAQVLLT